MKLSIVTTLYHSAKYIEEFYQRISSVAQSRADDSYEIILVNDGSPDNSLEVAIKLAETDRHVVLIDLSRNFGHHKAMMTGLAHAQGDEIFLIDSDLEEEPELLTTFAKQKDQDESDVIYGIQEDRKGNLSEKITGWLFYKIFRFFTGIAQPNNILTVRLMTKRYVQSLLTHKERELNIGGLWIITGFKQSPHAVQKLSNSPTTYSFTRKLSHLVNAVTSFSSLPLVFTFYAGILISLSAAGYITYLAFQYFFIATPPDGYTSIIASIWFFSGLIIFFIGVVGIYIAKIFSEVKQRPYTIIRNIYQSHKKAK